jgi:pimeloyl-ACP methyl ester carboxylesterase
MSLRILTILLLVGIGFAQTELPRIGYLGASVSAPGANEQGSAVRRVRDGSEAARIGLKPGDRILRANRTPIDSDFAIENVLPRFRAGEKVTLEILRDGKPQTLQATLPPLPQEKYPGVEVTHDFVTNSKGERLRTLISRPTSATGKVPVLFVVGWLSCDSLEYPFGGGSGMDLLVQYLVSSSGFATIRMDKPGVGDSEGVCANADFQSEITGYQAAFAAMKKYPHLDADRVAVVGLSNGGGFSPLAVGDNRVRAFVSSGSWGRTWYEHMLAIERGRLALSGSTPAQVNEAMKKFTEFYQMYLIQKMTPGQVLAKKPEWKSIWYDTDTTQYGRPAAFYQQLQDLNLGEAWAKVDAPVLVIRGEYDWIMPRADGEAIADIVNQAHPGRAKYVELPRVSHGLFQHPTLKDTMGGPQEYYKPVEKLVQDFLNEALR